MGHIKNIKTKDEVINLSDECQLRIISERFGITIYELKNAVSFNGPALKKVEAFLRERIKNTMLYIKSVKCSD